jgi:hypothetical protein
MILVNGLCHLADLCVEAGDEAGAVLLADEAVALSRRRGDRHAIAMTLDLSGYVARRAGDQQGAIRALRAAVDEARVMHSTQLPYALAGLAAALAAAGETGEALEAGREAMQIAEVSGSVMRVAEVSGVVGSALVADDPDRFAVHLAHGVALLVSLGQPRGLADAVVALAGAAVGRQPRAAARLLGALDAARRAAPSRDRVVVESKLVERLGEDVYDSERRAGIALTDDDLTRLAAEVAAGLVTTVPDPRDI